MDSRVLLSLAVALALAAVWPLVAVFNWFGVNVATLEQLGRTTGFRFFPSVLMFARPALAAAAALVIVFAAVRVISSHPRRAFAVLLKAAIAEALLAIAIAVSAAPVNAALSRMLPMLADPRTPGALVAPGHFVTLQDVAAESILPVLFGLALASGALALFSRLVKPADPGRAVR